MERTYQYTVNMGATNAGRIQPDPLAASIRTRLLASFARVTSGPSVRNDRVLSSLPSFLTGERYDVITRFVVEKSLAFTRADTQACDEAVFGAMKAATGAGWSVDGMRRVLPVDGTGNGRVGVLLGDIGTITRTVTAGNQTAQIPTGSDRVLSGTTIASTNPADVGTTQQGNAVTLANAAGNAASSLGVNTQILAFGIVGAVALAAVAVIVYKVVK